eukprot:5484002-Karenia_brevis.AAC.1
MAAVSPKARCPPKGVGGRENKNANHTRLVQLPKAAVRKQTYQTSGNAALIQCKVRHHQKACGQTMDA